MELLSLIDNDYSSRENISIDDARENISKPGICKKELVPTEISLRIAAFYKQFYRVKRMIRGIRVETILTYSQTLNR
jgi:hypothetical protein